MRVLQRNGQDQLQRPRDAAQGRLADVVYEMHTMQRYDDLLLLPGLWATAGTDWLQSLRVGLN